MTLTAEFYGSTLVLQGKGELTEETLPAFKEDAQHHLAAADIRDLVLDLDQITYVDSAALEYLLDLQDMLAERLGQVRLAGADESVRKIFEMTRLDEDFELFGQVGEAVKAASF
ncbi:MAG: STAS domain-containing protein [Planctomycetota bacterium]|nr:STAS domain-containing protein [Planctomycetota bacterium]